MTTTDQSNSQNDIVENARLGNQTPDLQPAQIPKSSNNPIEQIDDLFEKLSNDLEQTSRTISNGEFSQSGSGHLGNLFRIIQKLQGEDLINSWSNLLELCEKLWEEDYTNEAVKLIETAHLSLNTPDLFLDRVKEAIFNASNAVTAKRAEALFEQGDFEGALKIADTIDEEISSEYKQQLTHRQSQRLKLRQISIGVSALAIVCLVGISVHGTLGFVDYLKNPPKLQLPDFPKTNLLSQLSNARITEHPFPALQEDNPQITPKPLPLGYTPPKIAITELPEKTYNCILGIAASREALTILSEQPETASYDSAEQFINTVKKSCTSLDMAEPDIEFYITKLPSDKVQTISRNITQTF